MTVRFISLLTGLGVLDVYLQSLYRSSDPLFLFISNNKGVLLTQLLLAVIVVAISFKKSFRYRLSHLVCYGLALALGTFGLVGMVDAQLTNALYNWVKPVDFMISLDYAVCLGICALSFKCANLRLPVRNLVFLLASPFAVRLPRMRRAHPLTSQPIN